MTANINPRTGIRYGVVDARNLPWLLDEILASGTDNRYDEAKRELIARFEACETTEEANDIIREAHYSPDRLLLSDGELADADFDDLASEILSDTYESDGDSLDYTHESDGIKYQLGSLGGAPLLWIIESPFVTWCRQCSPCVPNAGDLNNLCGEDEGVHAYCFNPDDFDPDHPDRPKFSVREGSKWKWVSIPTNNMTDEELLAAEQALRAEDEWRQYAAEHGLDPDGTDLPDEPRHPND